jgi:hypothetical protein
MHPIPDSLYGPLKIVSEEVKKDLRKRGIAIPVKNNDGSISLGHYTIVKRSQFYAIIDYSAEVIVDQINLPQTAAVIANDLALGKFIDNDLLAIDRNYGYEEFEELLHIKSAEKNIKKNIDRADVMITKSKINRYKKEQYKRDIVKSFEKLLNFA